MKFFDALKKADFVSQLFAAAGLDFEALFKAGDAQALTAHIDSKVAAIIAGADKPATEAAAPVVLTAEHPEVAALIETQVSGLRSQVSSLEAQAAAYGASFQQIESAGIRLPVFTAGTQPEDHAAAVSKAINERISLRARELVAATGGHVIDEAPAADASASKPATTPKPELKGLARVEAAFRAQAAARRN